MEEENKARALVAEAARKQRGLFGEMIEFMRQHKKWWLAPIIISVLLFGLLVVLGGTAVAPFIYTLF